MNRLASLLPPILFTLGGCVNTDPTASGDQADSSASTAACGDAFTLSKHDVSSQIPTVGIVEWSFADGTPTHAKIIYLLQDAASATLNLGGEAPVNLERPNYRTLLLGLKQSRNYTFHIEATHDGRTCVSEEYTLPTTGTFPDARPVSISITRPSKREPGFIVTSTGTSTPSAAFILDADGEIVWHAAGPTNLTRALMDYEGDNMWMLGLNLLNDGGEMRLVSMDGEQQLNDVSGLEYTHHDFTVMPGGKVAALSWSGPGIDPESDLVIRSPDGTVTSPFRIGSNLYHSISYHANAIHYLPDDDSFTISDLNPNLFVKVTATGRLDWQFGGSCDEAPAGNRCSPQMWDVNHGHQLLEDGTFLFFNNSYEAESHVLQFKLQDTPISFTATLDHNYTGTGSSSNLGDAQRLPNGNTLITYSAEGKLVELDADWNEVQTFFTRFGYSSWRPTLYGPPPRL